MWLLACFIVAFVLAWLFVRLRSVGSDGRRIRPEDLPAPLWFAIVAYSLAAPILYLTVPTFWDHGEPAMAMKSLALARGEPLYPAVSEGASTQLVYGPAAFLLQSWVLRGFADPILGSKVYGLMCGWAGIGILAFLWSRRYPGSRVRPALFYCLATLLLFRQIVFRNQADSVLFLGIALATGAVTAAAPALRSVLWAVGIALALDAKLHGIVYALPLVPALIRQDGIVRALGATAAGALLAVAPFSQTCCDFEAFAGVVGALSDHHRPALMLFRNLCSAAAIAVPLGIALVEELDRPPDRARHVDARLTFVTVGLSMLVVSLVAAKEGAGTHHLIPFAATLSGLWILSQGRLHAVNDPRPRIRRQPLLQDSLLIAWLVAVLVQGAMIQRSYLLFVGGARDGRVAEEAVRIRESLQGQGLRIAFGYSDDAHYGVTLIRPLFWPILSANVLEPLALADLLRAGHPLASNTLQLFARQSFDLVILPTGGTPFSMTNWYDRRQRLFGADLTREFLSNYHVTEAHEYFTLWRANRLADRSGRDAAVR